MRRERKSDKMMMRGQLNPADFEPASLYKKNVLKAFGRFNLRLHSVHTITNTQTAVLYFELLFTVIRIQTIISYCSNIDGARSNQNKMRGN